MVTLEAYKTLEENGVYIHYSHEHYTDGTNVNFSIEFTKQKSFLLKRTQTGWYNDNHEFGDVYETMYKSIQLALWYLEDPKRIELIDSAIYNDDYIMYVNDKAQFITNLNK